MMDDDVSSEATTVGSEQPLTSAVSVSETTDSGTSTSDTIGENEGYRLRLRLGHVSFLWAVYTSASLIDP